jgi:hypothetical protein
MENVRFMTLMQPVKRSGNGNGSERIFGIHKSTMKR